jgi:hypothetical protein
MLGEEARQVPNPYSEASGQRINAIRVEGPSFNQGQGSLNRGSRAVPGRAEGSGLRSASEARAITSAFRRRRAWVEANIPREWRAYPADRPAIDPGRLDRYEQHPVQGWIASL